MCCGTCEGVARALVRGVAIGAPREMTTVLVTLQLRNRPGCDPYKVKEDGGVPKKPSPVTFHRCLHRGALDQTGGNQPGLKDRKVTLAVVGNSAGMISFANFQQRFLSDGFSRERGDSSYTVGL